MKFICLCLEIITFINCVVYKKKGLMVPCRKKKILKKWSY